MTASSTERERQTVEATSTASTRTRNYPLLVFFTVAALLFLIHGNRFVLTNDEGILLEPAQRMAKGARPYVDFFGYMSPGSYWIQAILFRLLGVNLWVARIPVILGFAIQSALVFWLTARLSSRRAAVAAAFVFVGFQIADPTFLTAQHRWDSATLALAGICCAIGYSETRHNNTSPFVSRRIPWALVASGALLALAAWCTPSIALVAVAESLWILTSRDRRHLFLSFAAGAAAVTVFVTGALWASGALIAFINQMSWLKQNYTAVNVMPYGSVIGGYGRLFEAAHGVEIPLRGLMVFFLALPAILPPLAIVLWGILTLRRGPSVSRHSEVLLLGLAASAFPRADLMHLAFVAALPYALVAAGLAQLLPARAGAILAFAVMPFALLFSLNHFSGSWSARHVSTPIGTVRAAPDVAPELADLVAAIHPGESLFVYPYMPVHYFVTQARNPTRFAFLAPGMMTSTEESAALAELSAQPPQWLLYMQLTRDEYLRVFPNAAALNPRFETLEAWLQSNYTLQTGPGVDLGGYRLWKRIEP